MTSPETEGNVDADILLPFPVVTKMSRQTIIIERWADDDGENNDTTLCSFVSSVKEMFKRTSFVFLVASPPLVFFQWFLLVLCQTDSSSNNSVMQS